MMIHTGWWFLAKTSEKHESLGKKKGKQMENMETNGKKKNVIVKKKECPMKFPMEKML